MSRIVIFSGLKHPIGDSVSAERHDRYAKVLSEKTIMQVELASGAMRSKSVLEQKFLYLKLIDCGSGGSRLRLSLFSILWASRLKKQEVPVLISSPDPHILGFLVIILKKCMCMRIMNNSLFNLTRSP